MKVERTICLGLLGVILAGTFFLTLPISTSNGSWGDFLVALFTSASAVCVNGLTVVDIGTYFSFWGQFFVLLLVQIGGLGYMTTTTFLIMLIGKKFDLRQKIGIQQSLDRRGMSGSSQIIRSIIATTIIFELTGAFLLMTVFIPEYGWIDGIWLGIFHSISAWNNSGFSLFKDSFISYQGNWMINFIIPSLIILGGIGYGVILEAYIWLRDRILKKSNKLVLSLDFKVATSTSLVLLMFGTLALLIIELRNPAVFGKLSLVDKFLIAWFQSANSRSGGFNSFEIHQMTPSALFILIIFMFIGASPGGTGSGIKTSTVRVLLSCTKAILQGEEEIILFKRKISVLLVFKSIGVLIGSVITIIVSTILIELIDSKFSFIKVCFEIFSAFGTGFSIGITQDFNILAKLILIIVMYIGRVGILLLINAIIGDLNKNSIRYPEENLLVG